MFCFSLIQRTIPNHLHVVLVFCSTQPLSSLCCTARLSPEVFQHSCPCLCSCNQPCFMTIDNSLFCLAHEGFFFPFDFWTHTLNLPLDYWLSPEPFWYCLICLSVNDHCLIIDLISGCWITNPLGRIDGVCVALCIVSWIGGAFVGLPSLVPTPHDQTAYPFFQKPSPSLTSLKQLHLSLR